MYTMAARWLMAGTLVALWAASAVVTSARQAPAQPQAPAVMFVPSGEGMPDGPGKEVTVRSCGTCHEARRAASARLTRAGWAAVIDSMIGRGARIADDEVPVVLDYLSMHFLGEAAQPLNVNTAVQIDFESAGGLLRREAAAVVRYRERNGRFKSVDDLKKVPGLDFSKIDRRRNAFIVVL
jgi:competence protein ComEA